MNELGFSRKLWNEELETYNAPVHYVSDHEVLRPESKSTPLRIVVDSSAVYKRHRFNNYSDERTGPVDRSLWSSTSFP